MKLVVARRSSPTTPSTRCSASQPLRGSEHQEALGMDVTEHGEEAYASGEGAILITPEAGIEEELPVADPGQ